MFRFPWGDFHSLNLGWFLQKFNELREDWATAEAGIDGALDAEIQKAEDALTDVFAARDAAAASASAANSSAQNASSSALNASQSSLASMNARDAARQAATNAAASETAAGNSATAASNSAGAAATSATQAGNSATAAGNSATAAGQSATNAAASETAAGNSAAAAAASETAAGNSASDAENAAQSVEQSAAQIRQNTADINTIKRDIVQNSKTIFYQKQSTEPNTFLYFINDFTDLNPFEPTYAFITIRHGKGATASSRKMGYIIGVRYTDNATDNIILDQNAFDVNKNDPHAYDMSFETGCTEHTAFAKINLYSDGILVGQSFVSKQSTKTIQAIYAVGAYFYTGTTQQKTFTFTGIISKQMSIASEKIIDANITPDPIFGKNTASALALSN